MKLENALVKRENSIFQSQNSQFELKVRKLDKELGLVRHYQSTTDKDTLVMHEKMIALEMKLQQSQMIQQ